MSNPSHGYRFIKDDSVAWAGTKKQRVNTQSKIFQASKMKRNKKRK